MTIESEWDAHREARDALLTQLADLDDEHEALTSRLIVVAAERTAIQAAMTELRDEWVRRYGDAGGSDRIPWAVIDDVDLPGNRSDPSPE